MAVDSKNPATLDLTHRPAVRPVAGAGRQRPDEPSETAPMVLIASPVAGLRKIWRESIYRFPVAEVADHGELERMVAHRRPAILLLDLDLPRLGGIGGVAAIHRRMPATKIVVLASPPDDGEGILALRMGARGYCDRGISSVLLAKAIEAVRNGEVWVGRKLTARLLDEVSALAELPLPEDASPALGGRLHLLTRRERAIVDLLGGGASNKEIARKLGVTERTVKAHLTAAFRKLGISGRLQAAIIAIRHGPSSHPPPAVGQD